MKKIMFNDKYGLTIAVLKGRKTMTRRIAYIGELNKPNSGYLTEGKLRGTCALCDSNSIVAKSLYMVGEVVAVAQSYSSIPKYNPETYEDVMLNDGTICEASHPYLHLQQSGGWDNKMFVRAELMPHRIHITNIRVERLQNISDEDCLREGIQRKSDFPHKKSFPFYFAGGKHSWDNSFSTPRKAFAALIDKVSGKGTWESNPYCFCYEFELIK